MSTTIKNNPLHRALSLSADLLCIYSLSLFIEKDITGYDIERSFMAKPYLRDHPNIDFSYSHTDKAIFCAISDEGKVGADIECACRTSDYKELLPALTTEEISYISNMDAAFRSNAVLALWTKYGDYIYSLFFSTSAGVNLFNLLTSSELITKYRTRITIYATT